MILQKSMNLNYNQFEDNLETMTDEEKELIKQYHKLYP